MTKTTNHKTDSAESFLWASTGKIVQIAMSTQQTLSDLLEANAASHRHRTDLYLDVGERLSKIAGKSPAWKQDYVQAVAAGTKAPSKRFARAVTLLAAAMDGQTPEFVEAQEMQVLADPAKVQAGSLVLGQSIQCKYPPCKVMFVPSVPWGKYCPAHMNPKSRK